jgi:hypothetical protein
LSKKKIYYEQESQKSYLYTEIKKKANILASISFVDPIWDGSCKHVPCKVPMQKVRMVIWLNICPRLSLQRLTWKKDWVSSGQLFYINKCILFHFFYKILTPSCLQTLICELIWKLTTILWVRCLVWYNRNLGPSQALSPGFSRSTCGLNLTTILSYDKH